MLLKKIKICSLIFLAQFFCIFNEVNANTLDEIKERGFINCGVSEEFIGFAAPNDSGNWVNIGKLFFQSRRYEKAIEAFNIALSINPDDDFANRAVRELESMRRNRIQ